MKVVNTVAELRAAVATARKAGQLIGFVPTMGALHAGHASLLKLARQRGGFVVCSIFVNPTQFGPKEDLAKYPRPLSKDLELCEREGVNLVFHPDVATMYPPHASSFVTVEGLSEVLEGASRPGHFRGVATVVSALFNQVQPDFAIFGQKDGQQVAVIQKLVRDLHIPVELIIGPTIREPDGLALSSRNVYLSPEQRRQAPILFQALELGRTLVAQGCRNAEVLRREMGAKFAGASLATLDYLALVDPLTMQPINPLAGKVMAAVAVRFGSTRLIDNMIYDIPTA